MNQSKTVKNSGKKPGRKRKDYDFPYEDDVRDLYDEQREMKGILKSIGMYQRTSNHKSFEEY